MHRLHVNFELKNGLVNVLAPNPHVPVVPASHQYLSAVRRVFDGVNWSIVSQKGEEVLVEVVLGANIHHTLIRANQVNVIVYWVRSSGQTGRVPKKIRRR